MEVWIDEKRPDVMSTANVVLALVIHVVCFLGFFLFARLHFKQKETVIPIDLTVVVNENLDGNENEPPPLDDPPPKPPERYPKPFSEPPALFDVWAGLEPQALRETARPAANARVVRVLLFMGSPKLVVGRRVS